MSKTPNYDNKLNEILGKLALGQERVCSMTGDTWVLDDMEIEICKKYRVPPSTIKPGTRLNMMNGYNTGLAIFWNTDVASGKPVISAIHPDLPFKVIEDIEWYKYDNAEFGKDIEDRPVVDQVWDLMTVVPVRARRNSDVDENSLSVGSLKTVDSYMTCSSSATRSFYTYAQFGAEDCVDVANGAHVARSFSVADCHGISDCEYVFSSHRCLKSSFLFDCRDCEYCFGVTNKRHAKYIWFNEQLSEEEWKKRRAEVDLGCRSVAVAWVEKFYTFWREQGIWPAVFGIGNEDCDGEHMFNSVRCRESYWQEKCTDCVRCRFGLEGNDCAYCSGYGWETRSYMSTGGVGGADNRFVMGNNKCVSLEYSAMCDECQNCFGCVGLSKKEYHIFNKPYSPDEYWRRVDELKCRMLDDGSYGEFLPGKFSLSGFEHSTGAVYYGFRERDLDRFKAIRVDPKQGLVLAPKREDTNGDKLRVEDVPDCIDDIDAKYVNAPMHDDELDRDFSVVPQELAVYKQKRWPFPRRHFIRRLTDLVRHGNSPFPIKVDCDKCHSKVTTYKNYKFPERTVYCMTCYNEFIETKT